MEIKEVRDIVDEGFGKCSGSSEAKTSSNLRPLVQPFASLAEPCVHDRLVRPILAHPMSQVRWPEFPWAPLPFSLRKERER